MSENLTNEDYVTLKAKIQDWKDRYDDRINHNHITVWHQGDPISQQKSIQVAELLKKDGYKIEFGSFVENTAKPTASFFDVSNAPDDSILVEVYANRAI